MKKLFLGAGILLFAIGAGSSFAQNKTTDTSSQNAGHSRVETRAERMKNMPPEKIAAIKTARLDKAVGLTAKQKSAVNTIYLSEAQQSKDRQAAHQESEKKIEAVLTKDQLLKLQDFKKERMEKMRTERQERATQANR